MMQKVSSDRRKLKQFYRSVIVIFLLINLLAYLGAYGLTHYKSVGQFGLGITRPISSRLPSDLGLPFTTQRIPINSQEWLETWSIPARNPNDSNGSVLLFPGNAGSKSKQLLAPANVFRALNYDTLLIDFRGVGGSSGNTTTLGIREAKDIALAMNYAQSASLKHPLILYGISMGSAAILRAVAQESVKPDAIILELPFARLLDAVGVRLRASRIPSFPLAELLIFWGGIQYQFNGFAHNPVEYAHQVSCPALILHGKLDRWTTEAEINQIYRNLPGSKQLVIFPKAGHDLLVSVDRERWQQSIEQFLTRGGSPKEG